MNRKLNSVNLNQLLKPWINIDSAECIIKDIKNDSRLIQEGDLFIAYPGAVADGRLFIEKAVSLGAKAVVYEPDNFPSSISLPTAIPCVPVNHLAEQLAEIAQRFYDSPSHTLIMTGVTGTNGKTTIAYQLAQAHSLLGQGSAYIGTIGQGSVHLLQPLDNTTPDALCLQRLLHQYKQQNIRQVCMEVSSHALSQHRVDFIAFKQAIFTNLTLDHLDYHHTMEAYSAAKAQLFANDSLEYAIINQDDEYQEIMSSSVKTHVKKITYGIYQECDVKAISWNMDIHGTEIKVQSPWGLHQLKIKALGQFNIYNGLAVFTSLMATGYEAEQVIQIMSQLKAAPGRMEIVTTAPYVLVDYAHTPDALENVLTTLNQLKKGKLWVVFGCGGDRDKTKRPIMGKAASLYADKVVVTSDNPRSEDPQLIMNDIVEGIASDREIIQFVNREQAIEYALSHAGKEDIILVAGKGHEAYQQIGSVKHAFSDQEIIKHWVR
jgi:UDP-N-acetylmuramoyl-L-alanyl-D-glutamate--2,6-diaminopimelate ligase